MELSAQIAELISNMPKLSPDSLRFAKSLIAQYERKQTLSEDQIPYISELIAEAKGEAA